MNPIISKGMAGIASSTVKTLTNIILKDFKYKYHIKCDKSQRDNDYEEYINCEFIDESVYNNVEFTILESFDKNRKATILALLCSTENHEDFVKYIINNANCYGFSLDRESDECKLYTRIIRDLVEEMFNPNKLSKYIDCLSENELYVQMFKGNNEIKDIILKLSFQFYQIPDLISALHKLINNLDKDLSTENINNCEIHDDNDEFLTKYNDDLFLEMKEYTGDDYIATLKSVYIEPRLEDEHQLLKEKLKGWNQKPDRQSYKRTDANAKIFLLYGKAGVGKSSFTSNAIATNLFGSNCHAIALRKHMNKLNHVKAWESVKDCFKCNDDASYNSSILILDGLDEICVLNKEFNGKEFVENLKNNAPSEVKILITSRNHEGYFKEVKPDNKLIISSMVWSDDEIINWCEKYCSVHKGNNEKQKWCENFLQSYNELESEDNRKDIFCTPIILYICCAKEIDISKHDSIAGIYDAAFRHISYREHSKENSEDFKNLDEKQFKISWQYTKELAFQMFLNDILESGLDDELVNEAKIRTKELLQETDFEIDNNIQRYFAVFHFAFGKTSGIEFAHKTVGEYFTAVKLYEDYFEKVEIKSGDDSAARYAWKTIYQAFRYKRIPEDIMKYLTDIIKSRKGNEYKEWRENFFEYYYIGMENQLLWEMMNDASYYKSNELFMLPEQVAIAYRNLTWLLSFLEFKNDGEFDKNMYKQTFESFFIRSVNMDVNCNNLRCCLKINSLDGYFINVDLKASNLSKARLSSANLRCANLIGAYLIDAHLSGADLTGANLTGANLTGANLTGANLTGANLIDADLSGANLIDANLSGANLSGANLIDADLTGADLNDIIIYETDLPKFDEVMQKYHIKLIDPDVICKEEHRGYIYDPETNRMIPPKE